MKRRIGLSIGLALIISGCANMTPTQQRVLSGTAGTTAAGAAIGAIAGNAGMGAAIGAGAGLVGSYLYDRHKQAEQRAYQQGYQQGRQQPPSGP
ncbi:YMGG-like glycine zipper-containing protein [Candidatus Methylocalor cossyra]|uniref:Gly-zipper_OmpA domain-containing protein n=1 Tax=Candidatus Methylocalor cossyra TaxID=3108543 RepID=A0ABP1CCT6_9GAMM